MIDISVFGLILMVMVWLYASAAVLSSNSEGVVAALVMAVLGTMLGGFMVM